MPSFAEGEAVALVKAGILARLRDGSSSAIRCREHVSQAIGEFLQGTSTASYLGGNVWAVTYTSVDVRRTTLEWKVFEFSGIVEPANQTTLAAMIC